MKKLYPLLCAVIVSPLLFTGTVANAADSKTIYFKMGNYTVRNIHAIQEPDGDATHNDRYYLDDYAKCRDKADGIGVIQCKAIQNDSIVAYYGWGTDACDSASSDVFITSDANKIRDKLSKKKQRASIVIEDSSTPLWVRYKQLGNEYFACLNPTALDDGQTITLYGYNVRGAYQ